MPVNERGAQRGSAVEVFLRFVPLGLTSFGGPAAHLGYFRRVFVEQLAWQTEAQYARLVALSQFLPGPGSSQTAFGIGVLRAGPLGGLAAFVAFTLPSFLLMVALAIVGAGLAESAWLQGLVRGMKLLAVVVVADATFSMARVFWQGRPLLLVGVSTTVLLLLLPSLMSQMAALALAGALGLFFLAPRPGERKLGDRQSDERVAAPEGSAGDDEDSGQGGGGRWWLMLFVVLLVASLLLPAVNVEPSSGIALAGDFYRAGSLVFGGGHVVLPMLQGLIGERLDTNEFLTGYAAAQAVPGPMFSLAAFLGAELWPTNRWAGAVIATLAIFLPGSLLVLALLGRWERLARRPRLQGAVRGLNAAVVGLLLSALYNPVFTSAVSGAAEMAWVVVGLGALRGANAPVVLLVAGFAVAGALGLGIG